MLGQPASSHTVCSPSRLTRPLRAWYSGPMTTRVLIHSGLRSIGVCALRTSRRSSLRPSGPTLVSDKCRLQTEFGVRDLLWLSGSEDVDEMRLHNRKHVGDADVPPGLDAERGDTGVDQAARHDRVKAVEA